MIFPGNIKAVKAAEHITMRRAHLIYGTLCLGNQSFIIRSTLLDQRLPEDLYWMFNSASDFNISIPALFSATRLLSWLQRLDSCSDISYCIPAQLFHNCFSSSCDLQPKGSFIQAAIKALLKLINILASVILFSFFQHNRRQPISAFLLYHHCLTLQTKAPAEQEPLSFMEMHSWRGWKMYQSKFEQQRKEYNKSYPKNSS